MGEVWSVGDDVAEWADLTPLGIPIPKNFSRNGATTAPPE